MKKLITFVMSLLIMTTMTGTNIHADDSGSITEEGGSQEIGIESIETVSDTVNESYKITVTWSTTPATCVSSNVYDWNTDTLKYEMTDIDISKTEANAKITLTNYSNIDIDYAISYSPNTKKINNVDTDISSEAAASQTDSKTGTITTADTVGGISTEDAGNAQSSEYNGIISYTSDYQPTDSSNVNMGTYSIKISKHLTIDKTSLSLKTGRTYTSLKASTPVTWSSSNTNVATVDSTGKVTAIADGTANIIATSSVTGLTVTSKVTVKSSGAYFLNNCQEDFDLLLATDETDIVSYTDPETSKTVYAYNGFINETGYATFVQAQTFVAALNAANIKPSIVSQGTTGIWRLIKSENDGRAWATATINEENGFDGITCLWSSIAYNTGAHFFWNCDQNGWYINWYGDNGASAGFVVIWEPAN